MFSSSLPDCKRDLRCFALQQPNIHINMSNILRQCSSGSSNGNETRLDGNFNIGGDFEFFGLEDVPHLGEQKSINTTSKLWQTHPIASNSQYHQNLNPKTSNRRLE